MKKRGKRTRVNPGNNLFSIIAIGVLVIVSIGVFAYIATNPSIFGHNSEKVFITIDGVDRTLQQAIDSGEHLGSHTYTESLSSINGHWADSVWVSVRAGEMTLLQALQTTYKLCPSVPLTTDYSSSPSDNTKPYHYATEIELSSGVTLQQAIDNNDLCQCVADWEQPCSPPGIDAFCIIPGITQCDGTCSGSYKPQATACGADDWHTCDGKGGCLGWKGLNCAACPFGSYRIGSVAVCYTAPGLSNSQYRWTDSQGKPASNNPQWWPVPPYTVVCKQYIMSGEVDSGWQMKP